MPKKTTDLKIIFSDTWIQYKQRAVPIINVMLISFGIVLIAAVIYILIAVILYGTSFLHGSVILQENDLNTLSIIALFLAVSVVILWNWNMAAVFAIVMDKNLNFISALQKGRHYLWHFCSVSILLTTILMLGFSFFIIPGIIFSVWFAFSLFVLFDENKKGISALLISREYTRGYGFNTFLKLASISLISLIVFSVAFIFPVIGQFLYYAYTPYFLLFLFSVYNDLKKVQSGKTPTPQGKIVWSSIAVISLILPLIFLGGFLQQIISNSLAGTQIIQTPAAAKITSVCDLLDDGNLPDCKKAQFVESKVFWHDTVGDVTQTGAGKWLDIRKVSIENREDAMQMTIKINDQFTTFPAAAIGTREQKVSLLTLYIDRDLDKNTGGKDLPKTGRNGYDYEIDVLLEAAENMAEPKVQINLFKLEGALRSSINTLPIPQQQIHIAKDELVVRVPYSFIGITPGNLSRLCYHESAQGPLQGISLDHYIAAE
jgi:hypothetical protein